MDSWEDMVLELYHFYGATCGLKARLAVEEKHIPVVDRAVERPHLRTPEYRALNPNGVVPTLVHDGCVLTESTVIINYLDDLSPDWPLKPGSALGMARVLWWMKRADECLPIIVMLTYTVSMRPKLLALSPDELEAYLEAIPSLATRMRRRRIIQLGYDNPEFEAAIAGLRTMLDDMEQALSGHRWLVDDTYTLADTSMTPLIERLEEMTFAAFWSPIRPKLHQWWEQVQARPSYDACVRLKRNPDSSQHRRNGQQGWPEVRYAFFG